MPADLVAEPRSARALLTLFSAQPAVARRIAEEMLAGPLPPNARRRCLMVRLAALMVGDRPDEAQKAGTELTILLRTHPTPPSARSLSTAIAATAELFGNRSGELPRAAGSTGRWPTPLDPMGSSGRDGGGSPLPGPVWPLLEGVRHHLAGDCAAAAVSLREATVQQLAGEGLFRSEATGGLVVVLAETGHLAEARKVLADNGPDARWVRISPLPDWPGSGPVRRTGRSPWWRRGGAPRGRPTRSRAGVGRPRRRPHSGRGAAAPTRPRPEPAQWRRWPGGRWGPRTRAAPNCPSS